MAQLHCEYCPWIIYYFGIASIQGYNAPDRVYVCRRSNRRRINIDSPPLMELIFSNKSNKCGCLDVIICEWRATTLPPPIRNSEKDRIGLGAAAASISNGWPGGEGGTIFAFDLILSISVIYVDHVYSPIPCPFPIALPTAAALSDNWLRQTITHRPPWTCAQWRDGQ